jgi:hypothetical protein
MVPRRSPDICHECGGMVEEQRCRAASVSEVRAVPLGASRSYHLCSLSPSLFAHHHFLTCCIGIQSMAGLEDITLER